MPNDGNMTSDNPTAVNAHGPQTSLKIAMIGTRGIPAAYGGFETAVEEVGKRLASRGHSVTVYCRKDGLGATHLEMNRVELPALRRRSLETLSRSALSVLHASLKSRPDVVFLFNAANSPLIPMLKARNIPVATHTDGLEWKRGKWGRLGRRYYLRAEKLAARWSTTLISDAQAIADYYQCKHRKRSDVIAYGAPIVNPSAKPIEQLGLEPGEYDLIVARMEPENHIYEGVLGALEACTGRPLVLVSGNPYRTDYASKVESLAQHPFVRHLGSVWDQELLDSLYAHARAYVHGHSVGGTNPSLLRAMGAGAAVLAYDVEFNREVLGTNGMYWQDAPGLSELLGNLSRDDAVEIGRRNRAFAAVTYDWDDVADEYEKLAYWLVHRSRKREGRSSS